MSLGFTMRGRPGIFTGAAGGLEWRESEPLEDDLDEQCLELRAAASPLALLMSYVRLLMASI